jgi:hypothetical protein
MNNKYYIVFLIIFLTISLVASFATPNILQEGMINLDSQYLNMQPQSQDSDGNYYLPSGYYIVQSDTSNVDNGRIPPNMALIPPGYIITPDNTGIFIDPSLPANSENIFDIKPDKDNNYNVQSGYYKIGNTKMAIIPYGFKTNSSGTGITLNPLVNVINSPVFKNSPTSNLTDENANSLLKYSSNNYNLKYHDDISLNDQLGQIHPNPVYYQPGTFKYGGSTYVPSYEDSVYLSKTTLLPTVSPYKTESSKRSDICSELKFQPNKLENVCNNMDKNSCKNSKCCLLLGGSKCVSGNELGPTMKYNYSNYLVQNRDYYYYNGRCFGNCPLYETSNNL